MLSLTYILDCCAVANSVKPILLTPCQYRPPAHNPNTMSDTFEASELYAQAIKKARRDGFYGGPSTEAGALGHPLWTHLGSEADCSSFLSGVNQEQPSQSMVDFNDSHSDPRHSSASIASSFGAPGPDRATDGANSQVSSVRSSSFGGFSQTDSVGPDSSPDNAIRESRAISTVASGPPESNAIPDWDGPSIGGDGTRLGNSVSITTGASSWTQPRRKSGGWKWGL